jgi:hypothetical protein
MTARVTERWSVPYIDQPLPFWEDLHERFGANIHEVYFPPPLELLGSGRPALPDTHLQTFLARAPVTKALLLNAVTLPGPVRNSAQRIVDYTRRLGEQAGITRVTVANLALAEELRRCIPDLTITGSVLMDVSQPNQALMLEGICDNLVPGAAAMRHLPSLKALKRAFRGKIRLLVNEACLGGCLHRMQHFHEMCTGVPEPRSLCDGVLEREPWLRLTGAWVTPQYLHHYESHYDELKLAGRATLQAPERYFAVLTAYMERRPLLPNAIGGGPASVIEPIDVPEDLFVYTLHCGQQCHACRKCEEHYYRALQS